MTDPIRLNLRLTFPGGVPLSHGKAELMELIRETGSISQAAAKMGMSYRRAWLLVDELNHLFREPSIETKQGGKSGGGAALTAFGEALLKRFRTMEKRTMKALSDDLDWLAANRADQAPDPGAR
ncbi:winged helix-turn-helix domain-containing protein [Rhizobium sp.]